MCVEVVEEILDLIKCKHLIFLEPHICAALVHEGFNPLVAYLVDVLGGFGCLIVIVYGHPPIGVENRSAHGRNEPSNVVYQLGVVDGLDKCFEFLCRLSPGPLFLNTAQVIEFGILLVSIHQVLTGSLGSNGIRYRIFHSKQNRVVAHYSRCVGVIEPISR